MDMDPKRMIFPVEAFLAFPTQIDFLTVEVCSHSESFCSSLLTPNSLVYTLHRLSFVNFCTKSY